MSSSSSSSSLLQATLEQEDETTHNSNKNQTDKKKSSIMEDTILRNVSWTDTERQFLSLLFFDHTSSPTTTNMTLSPLFQHSEQQQPQPPQPPQDVPPPNTDTEETFFVPFTSNENISHRNPPVHSNTLRQKTHSTFGLWKAHEMGIPPKLLRRKSSLLEQEKKPSFALQVQETPNPPSPPTPTPPPFKPEQEPLQRLNPTMVQEDHNTNHISIQEVLIPQETNEQHNVSIRNLLVMEDSMVPTLEIPKDSCDGRDSFHVLDSSTRRERMIHDSHPTYPMTCPVEQIQEEENLLPNPPTDSNVEEEEQQSIRSDQEVRMEKIQSHTLKKRSPKQKLKQKQNQEKIIISRHASKMTNPSRFIRRNRSDCSSSESVHQDHAMDTKDTNHHSHAAHEENDHGNGDDNDHDSVSSSSSWDVSEGGFDHYDAWGVLKDEYAQDFGFTYHYSQTSQKTLTSTNPITFKGPEETRTGGDKRNAMDNDVEKEEDINTLLEPSFRILGTSAEDVNAHPHVLSPPLMESLLNFVPDTLNGDNFWLKYSLLRDGASLDILRRYVRAAQYTILALETTTGHVIGSFTSHSWKNHPEGYFGSGESFVWKMRHSRKTPCFSLFDQAQMESEIDVYPYSAINNYVQLCNSERIGIGGGSFPINHLETELEGKEDTEQQSKTLEHHHNVEHSSDRSIVNEDEEIILGGFAIMVKDDLSNGVSCPCATYRSPCLVNPSSKKGETFQVVNLEIWTFTSSNTVEEAEKLEMRKFFIEESIHSDMMTSSQSLSDHHRGDSLMTRVRSERSGSDFSQKKFYRRVGDPDDNEVEREAWNYRNTMDG